MKERMMNKQRNERTKRNEMWPISGDGDGGPGKHYGDGETIFPHGKSGVQKVQVISNTFTTQYSQLTP